MKFSHISDTHLGQYRSKKEREDDTYNAFKQAIEISINDKVDFVIFSGDIFDKAQPPNDAILHMMEQLNRLKENGIKSYFVLGDHDQPKVEQNAIHWLYSSLTKVSHHLGDGNPVYFKNVLLVGFDYHSDGHDIESLQEEFKKIDLIAKEHPDAISVGYVNTTAEIKSELDYCCTSSNAVNVVNAIPKEKEILFLPDMFLGSYVAKITGRKNMQIWAGECHVHAGITPDHVEKKLAELKNAEFIIHPECSCTTPMMHDVASGHYKNHQVQILSTEGMMNHVSKSASQQFVVATETGILYRMRQQNPEKTFIPASETAECEYMKMITLDKVYRSLYDEKYEVKVAKKTADKARLAIERMLSIS